MAKMTISGLQTFVASYVAEAKQVGEWTDSTDNLIGLIDKVGKMITLDGDFQDKLPEMNGDDLPLGKTIEEWFQDLILPTDYDSTGANTLAPAYPSYEAPAYSYSLGRKTIKTTLKYDDCERACINANDVANITAKVMERLANSYSLYTYAQKKQLLGNAINKANTAGLITSIATPVDTATSEAFIKQIKKDVEDASFASENTSFSKTLIGSAPSLTLYIKKGVMPVLEVDALAGAFNKGDLAIPATIKVVDDFGVCDVADAYAVLADSRGLKLHRGYNAVREQMNADGDFLNVVQHSENTAFISNFTYFKAYKNVAA